MTETTDDRDIEEIKEENDKIIMKIFGLKYEKAFLTNKLYPSAYKRRSTLSDHKY
ncbi:MAG: hypothetical protein M3P28_00685 [Thermoproteota archaeon]|nr:hypothetical protein [Thermoproteota archaeon]